MALAFIGGVPELIVPDNSRALLSAANRYEPELNPATLEFAQHYGTVILPARPRKPQDKAKVEVGVQVVERPPGIPSASAESSKLDRYGRVIGKVLVNGQDVNLEQVRRGCGWHYKK